LAGLVGAGRTEVARAVFGIDKPATGEIELDGKPVRIGSPAAALAHGIAYVSEDRRGQSIVEDFSILDNATLPVIDQASRLGLIRHRAEFALVDGPLQRMQLKFRSYAQPIGNLSGGNQQKVVLAKWLNAKAKVLILDHPTRGLDVGAKEEVYELVRATTSEGVAVVLTSDTLEETIGLSHTVLVMRDGMITHRADARPGRKPRQVDLIGHMV
jgi:ABC-type sugar transport system ATPase subunit